jgi:hypothetical protein
MVFGRVLFLNLCPDSLPTNENSGFRVLANRGEFILAQTLQLLLTESPSTDEVTEGED